MSTKKINARFRSKTVNRAFRPVDIGYHVTNAANVAAVGSLPLGVRKVSFSQFVKALSAKLGSDVFMAYGVDGYAKLVTERKVDGKYRRVDVLHFVGAIPETFTPAMVAELIG